MHIGGPGGRRDKPRGHSERHTGRPGGGERAHTLYTPVPHAGLRRHATGDHPPPPVSYPGRPCCTVAMRPRSMGNTQRALRSVVCVCTAVPPNRARAPLPRVPGDFNSPFTLPLFITLPLSILDALAICKGHLRGEKSICTHILPRVPGVRRPARRRDYRERRRGGPTAAGLRRPHHLPLPRTMQRAGKPERCLFTYIITARMLHGLSK
eukprot:COSAG05_NODE_1584_length_4486_cov_402.617506_10_plen_209_part_00